MAQRFGLCLGFFPKWVPLLDPDDRARVTRPEECICCSLCQIRCPDLAIELFTVADDAVKDAV
ncbi:4Fe-4S ferredoxin [Desulforhopalus sp. IMCC35007]|nr:4Fe-4S ferredoxin [Desulforhopalus sp. IMCC35007]